MGAQFMLHVEGAADLVEAKRIITDMRLSGIFLSPSASPSTRSLRHTIEDLRRASPQERIPIALVAADGEELARIRGVWAGASALATKPMTPRDFDRLARRLISVSQSYRSSILLLSSRRQLAERINAAADPLATVVREEGAPRQIFELLERYHADLLIVDACSDHSVTYECCRALRSLPRWRDFPLVVMTERDNPEARIAAYRSGADDVFHRGLSTDELRVRLRVRLERAQMIRERADFDYLTGLLTRRAFLEQLAMRLSEAARHDRRISFCLIDVDHFKDINDRFGHPTGDRVLSRLGQLLRECFRAEDLRCRWGGEEFAVVLVGEDSSTARLAIERLLREFRQLRFSAPGGEQFSVSFSAGISVFPEDGSDGQSLVAAADRRLLKAKRAGRNTIVATGP